MKAMFFIACRCDFQRCQWWNSLYLNTDVNMRNQTTHRISHTNPLHLISLLTIVGNLHNPHVMLSM